MTEKEEYKIRRRIRKEVLENDILTTKQISDILVNILKEEIQKFKHTSK